MHSKQIFIIQVLWKFQIIIHPLFRPRKNFLWSFPWLPSLLIWIRLHPLFLKDKIRFIFRIGITTYSNLKITRNELCRSPSKHSFSLSWSYPDILLSYPSFLLIYRSSWCQTFLIHIFNKLSTWPNFNETFTRSNSKFIFGFYLTVFWRIWNLIW